MAAVEEDGLENRRALQRHFVEFFASNRNGLSLAACYDLFFVLIENSYYKMK